MLRRFGNWLTGWLSKEYQSSAEFRAAPQQALEAQIHYLYAPHPRYDRYLYAAATNIWVYTAVSRLAERFCSVHPEVITRKGAAPFEHPLLVLIGEDGRPNESMDSLELLNQTAQQIEIYGNAYWYFAEGQRAGYDFDIYPLQPEHVFIQPSSTSRLKKYVLREHGKDFELEPDAVIHFKRPSFNSNSYYGQSASEVLLSEVVGDNSMRDFNQNQFEDGIPNGILFVDYEVTDKDTKRIADELAASHKDRRRVAVLRSPRSGKAAFFDAGMNPRDMDFKEGRLLSRQACFDALGFHVGLVSEASTEAHARVARGEVMATIWTRHNRMASVLNSALSFWSAANRYRVRFPDVRIVDWEQEAKHLQAVAPYMTPNEVRTTILHLPPIADGDKLISQNGGSQDDSEGSQEAGKKDAAAEGSAGKTNQSSTASNNSAAAAD